MADIEKALQIQGFMSEAELEQLAIWASASNLIVEIGCYMGRSTRALADNTSGTVYTFDDFLGLRENPYNPKQEEIRNAFEENLHDHIVSRKVTLLEMNHGRPKQIPCDMCFIDGSHDYASVSRDILFWQRLTKGILCGHDFDVQHRDVQEAVDLFLPGYRIVPGTTLWWVNL